VGRRTLENGGADLWICEIGRNAASRFTYEPGVEAQPTWSPDGRRIVWGNAQKATPKLWWKALGETGGGEAISPGPFQFPTDWSKDGRFILFQTSGTDVRSELWVLAVDQRKPLPLIQTQFSNSAGAFSPDGKWTAFVSDDSGRSEIYVQAFQGEGTPKVYGERYLISRGGGFGPRWRGDGRELYFISADNRLMSVSVKGGSVFHSGEPAALFRMPSPMYLLPTQSTGFDVFPDGQRFIVAITDPVDVRPLTMIVNWQAGLSRQTGER
jgi:Tol biopolymer transport system component